MAMIDTPLHRSPAKVPCIQYVDSLPPGGFKEGAHFYLDFNKLQDGAEVFRSLSPPRRRVFDSPHAQLPECFSTSGSACAPGATRHRILAFGDSLTAGYHSDGERFAPYAAALAQSLGGCGHSAEIWACGLSGLSARQMLEHADAPHVRDFAGRAGPGLRHLLREQGPFSLALLMAGTNDLGKQSPAAIARSVEALHAVCHREGVPTVMLLVPPNRSTSRSPKHRERWRQVNALLSDWAQSLGRKDGVTLCLDTSTLVPFTPENGLWEDDGLHFSAAGSRQLGCRLAALVGPLLADGAAQAKGVAVRRPIVRAASPIGRAASPIARAASAKSRTPPTPAMPARPMTSMAPVASLVAPVTPIVAGRVSGVASPAVPCSVVVLPSGTPRLSLNFRPASQPAATIASSATVVAPACPGSYGIPGQRCSVAVALAANVGSPRISRMALSPARC